MSVEAATTAREYLEGGGKKPDLKYDLKGGYFRVREAAEEAPPPKKKRGRPPKSPAAAEDDAAATRSGPPSARPSDVPNGSLRYNQENPKKRGSKSWHRYESYKKATTVDEYFRLQGTLGDLKYDFSRGFFKAPPALARWCASK